jgi:hypothetical protein
MTKYNTTQDIESLAASIGDNVYIDVTKWHLYLKEAHLHILVAEKVYPLLAENRLTQTAVTQILREIPVKLGGGKVEIPLIDLIPKQCEGDLMELLENYQL